MSQSHIVVKSFNSCFNIVCKPVIGDSCIHRLFTTTSLLYRSLNGNYDVTEKISNILKKQGEAEVLKSIQQNGRKTNKALKSNSYKVFDLIGFNQEEFLKGFEYIQETWYDSIDNDLKHWYDDIIEEAFFTTTSRYDFYQFIRNASEGCIVTKKNFTMLLNELLVGIQFMDNLDAYFAKHDM